MCSGRRSSNELCLLAALEMQDAGTYARTMFIPSSVSCQRTLRGQTKIARHQRRFNGRSLLGSLVPMPWYVRSKQAAGVGLEGGANH